MIRSSILAGVVMVLMPAASAPAKYLHVDRASTAALHAGQANRDDARDSVTVAWCHHGRPQAHVVYCKVIDRDLGALGSSSWVATVLLGRRGDVVVDGPFDSDWRERL